MRLELVAFTKTGAALAARLLERYPESRGYAPQRLCADSLQPLEEPIGDWAKARFRSGNALVFVGAAGIAVRAIAPHVREKDRDPAVLCVDERGQYVIPLLSGHLGGANALARELAAALEAIPVITAATDVEGVFSPDDWARTQGCAVGNRQEIKHLSAALLEGETIGLSSDFPVAGRLPPGVALAQRGRWGIEIRFAPSMLFERTLHLIPRIAVAGIGCRKGVGKAVLLGRLRQVLSEEGIPLEAVGTIASIDLKRDEAGLIALGETLRANFTVYSAGELMAAPGEFTASERVLAVTGADNVCERAAVLAAGEGGRLICRKTSGEGVTVALALREWGCTFESITDGREF